MLPYLIEDAQARYQQRVHEADQYRLAKLVQAPQHQRRARVRVTIGKALIALGQRLNAPAASVAPPR